VTAAASDTDPATGGVVDSDGAITAAANNGESPTTTGTRVPDRKLTAVITVDLHAHSTRRCFWSR
jgi:hypothetical protein